MSNHQRETAFLRQCILYDDTTERHRLDARLTQAQRDERCVRCAVWLMALFTALALVGLGYSAVFLADFPQNKSHLPVKLLGALGLASLTSLVAFVGFWGVHRKELDQRREECRRLATKLFESRLGKAGTMPLPEAVKDRENVANGSEAAMSASEGVKLPKALVEASGSPGCRPRLGRWRRGGENDFEKQFQVTGKETAKTKETA